MQKRWRSLRREALAQGIGARIREQRQARGLRLETLASMLEIPAGWLARYESGDLMVPTYTLYQLSGALDLNVGVLFPGETSSLESEFPAELSRELGRLARLDQYDREALADFIRTTLDAIVRLKGIPS